MTAKTITATPDTKLPKLHSQQARVQQAIAQLEPQAHDLETQINDAVAVLADALPQWRSIVKELNSLHGTNHHLLPEGNEQDAYCKWKIKPLSLPILDHSDSTGQPLRLKWTDV